MNTQKLFSKKGVMFLAIFVLLTYIGMQLNFSPLLGLDSAENQTFTFFQFLGPIAGGFLGGIVGAISVFLSQFINYILLGKEFNFINLFRLFPMIFGAYYFAKNKDNFSKDKLSFIIPIICIAAFILHPIGSQAWYYSLFWTIPLLVKFLPENLFFRSLGSTFTAHAIGSVIFLYTIPTVPELWAVILPGVVVFERVIFALGISASYIVFNTLLSRLETLTTSNLRDIVKIEDKYVLSTKNLHL
ncbi:MAG: hypothetical protein PHU63_02800 [Candidatus ainarchaeum sp.]|nr:hypothetical protein [Candidatus ainarchaeum sp.]